MSGPLPQEQLTMSRALLEGVRYGLHFNAKGESVPQAKWIRRCVRLMESIPNAHGYRPKGDGVVRLDQWGRTMEQNWRELSFTVQGACLACPYRARKQCKGAKFD